MTEPASNRRRDELTPKQRRFVEEYLIDLNATQAAIRAGYSAKTAEVQGCRLLRNAQVRALVEAGQVKARERCEVTRDTIAKQLDEDRQLAHDVEQAGAAVSATVAKAKLFGFMKDKVEVTGEDGGPIKQRLDVRQDLTGLSDDELARKYREALAAAGGMSGSGGPGA